METQLLSSKDYFMKNVPAECKGVCSRDVALVDCETLAIYTNEKCHPGAFIEGFNGNYGGITNKIIKHYIDGPYRFCSICNRFLTRHMLNGTRCKCCNMKTRLKSKYYRPRKTPAS